jgi:hypothetical protein
MLFVMRSNDRQKGKMGSASNAVRKGQFTDPGARKRHKQNIALNRARRKGQDVKAWCKFCEQDLDLSRFVQITQGSWAISRGCMDCIRKNT